MMASSGTGFSYAQAAKGLAPSTQSTSAVPSSVASEQGGKDAVMVAEIPTTERPRQPSTELSPAERVHTLESITMEAKKSTESPNNNKDETVPTTSTHAVHSKQLSDHIDEGEGEVRNENGAILETSEKTAQHGENEKGKDTDDDWEKVSLPSATTEKELKAAPIPTVNIWQQRREAQDAKLKDVVTQKPIAKPRVTVQTSMDEPRRRLNNRDHDKDTGSTPRQTNFHNRTFSERKDGPQISPRTSGHQESRNTTPLRPATDAASWPTPDTSTTTDERRRSSILERSERPDIKGGNQKKWVQMPFVPTAKFETQLPPAAARRGGRPANRGRENGGRGSIASPQTPNSEKPEPGSMGPPPLPNKIVDHERGRKHAGAQNPRASSVPSQGPRTPSIDGQPRDGPRYSVPHAKTPVESTRSSEPFLPKIGTTVSDDRGFIHDSRSSSRNTPIQTGGRKSDQERRNSPQSATSQGAGLADAGSRFQSSERHRGLHNEGNRASIDLTDRSFSSSREWSRGRPDSIREKSESWRGRESRTERGRGGYRGRGGHSSYNSHMSPTAYSPSGAQNGLEGPKSAGPFEGRNTRQTSQPYTQAQSMVGSRGNPRSQSIPIAMMQGGFYSPVQGFPQALSPTDMNFSQYQQQVPGGIMSAMPYADQLNSYALISMVITQLEYYFSIDNLCKDMFLRKNMDSQGFVPLSVIANFKRIKALTDGQMAHDQLRSVCQQVRNVEFVVGEDGEDKLRSRENWRDFILPIEERLPSAQNEGPSIRSAQSTNQHGQGDFQGINGNPGSPADGLNGFMEPFNQSVPPMGYAAVAPFDGPGEHVASGLDSQSSDHLRRESATSPFTNVTPSHSNDQVKSPASYLSNGHNHATPAASYGENAFPDEKIPELKVVVRDPTYEPSQAADQSEQRSNAEALSLRGGAASTEQLNHFESMQYGQTPTSPRPQDSDQPPYWTKDGEIAQIPTGPGFVHEDYLPLREKALAQRLDNHLDGALRVLYAFWSSFLIEHFNLSMYQEFSTLAREDIESGSETGKTYLVSFYDALLTGRTIISERIASDIVELARSETGDRRPLWQKLRTAWRNGATNMKTRKRLGDVLTTEEKTDFDKIA